MFSLFALCIWSVSAFDFSDIDTFQQSQENQPNILVFLADDMAYHDVDNEQISTPNLNRLSDQGMTFNRMFNSASMCAPTRMSLYTGIHPVRNGAHPNHSKVYPDIRSMPHYLNDLGYRTALIGKRHEAPKENFPFEFLGGRHHDDGEGVDLELDSVKTYMEENKGEPWSLVVASNQPHRPWNRGTDYTYDADRLDLPPYLVDTPETGEWISNDSGNLPSGVDAKVEVGVTPDLLEFDVEEISAKAGQTIQLFFKIRAIWSTICWC